MKPIHFTLNSLLGIFPQKTTKTYCERRTGSSFATRERDNVTCPDCIAELKKTDKAIAELQRFQLANGSEPVDLKCIPFARPVEASV